MTELKKLTQRNRTMRLRKGDIVVFNSSQQVNPVNVVEIQDIRDATQNADERRPVDAKYLYLVMRYGNGDVTDYYDCEMDQMIVLSNRQFINSDLKSRFDKFRERYNDSMKIRELIKKQSIEQDRLSSEAQGHVDRLHLNDTPYDVKVRVVFYNGKKLTGRYLSLGYYSNDKLTGKFYVLNPGINTSSEIIMEKVQSVELLEEVVQHIQDDTSDPYANATQLPNFVIPEYEKINGYSDEFWMAFENFICSLPQYPRKKFRFILNGDGFYDNKFVSSYERHPPIGDLPGDITITLKTHKGIAKSFSLGIFREIIWMSEDDGGINE